MQPIDLSRLVKNINTSETETTTSPERRVDDAMVEKQRLAIALLLKQTVQNLTQDGLPSIDSQKAIISAKKIFPSEFTQLYIQERLQQHRIAESLANQVIKPVLLNKSTVSQWFSGQLIQAIVYQTTVNGLSSLLVNAQGQFDPALLAQISKTQISEQLIRQSQQVNIKTALSLQTGQQLLLEVIKEPDQFSFRLHSSPSQSQKISEHLNQLLNKQQSLNQILSSLNEITHQNASARNVFTPRFIEQVEKIIQQTPQLSQLGKSQDLKNALQNSGQFLENSLSPANRSPTGSDFKAGLMQLQSMILNNEAVIIPKNLSRQSSTYNTIAQTHLLGLQSSIHQFFELPAKVIHAQVQKPLAPEMSLFLLHNPLIIQAKIVDQLEGALARIISGQLQSRESGEQAVFSFELPFRHNNQTEVLQLKIREQLKQEEAQKGNKIWTVNLAFNLQSLGGIRIYMTLDQMELAMQIWTEEAHTQILFQQNFYQLKERLLDAGFNISQLKAYHGIPDSAVKEQQDSPFIINEQV